MTFWIEIQWQHLDAIHLPPSCCRMTTHGPMLRRSVHNSWKSLSIDLSFLLLCRLTNNQKCHQITRCHISHGNLCVLVCLLWVAINQSVFHHLKEGGLSENVKHFGGRTVWLADMKCCEMLCWWGGGQRKKKKGNRLSFFFVSSTYANRRTHTEVSAVTTER